MIRVILFEDNKSLRQSLSLVLTNTEGVYFSGAFADANDAIARIHNHRPDVVLMDIQMPGISGIEAMQQIKAKFPTIKVLIQTVFEDEHRIFQAICGGASGYVLKNPDPEILVKAIFDVYAGGSNLSPTIAAKVMAMFQNQFIKTQATFVALTDREKDVLACMVRGMSYKMIADACGISFNTVHWHVKNIYEKLHVNSAPEAVAKAIEQRLV
jgi:DNA-binding NarL/FixJ family response regulator